MRFKSTPVTKKGWENPQPKHSYGRAVPRSSMEACLCADKQTYSKKCCKGYLINQGIGITISAPTTRAFSSGFSDGFS